MTLAPQNGGCSPIQLFNDARFFPRKSGIGVDIGAFELQLAPTAAAVSITGRILTLNGKGLRNTRVILTDMHGNTQTARSGTLGYFRFDEVEAGQTCIISVISKLYQFTPQIVNVVNDIEELNFAAQSETRREK